MRDTTVVAILDAQIFGTNPQCNRCVNNQVFEYQEIAFNTADSAVVVLSRTAKAFGSYTQLSYFVYKFP